MILNTPILGTGTGAVSVKLTAGEALVKGDLVTVDSSGEAVRASATFSTGRWRLEAVALESVSAGSDVAVALSGSLVEVKFGTAPASSLNQSYVFLDTTDGEGVSVPSFASGTVQFIVGVLQGADGSTTTPTVLFRPQYQARRP